MEYIQFFSTGRKLKKNVKIYAFEAVESSQGFMKTLKNTTSMHSIWRFLTNGKIKIYDGSFSCITTIEIIKSTKR